MQARSITPSRPTGPVATAPAPRRGRLARFNQRVKSPTVFLLVVLSAQMMVVLDGTIVNVALPHIRTGLGFSAAGLSWALNAYILTFGGLMLLGARSGDLQGRRRTFLLGVSLFSLGSLLGGFAGSPAQFLAARALQGVGAAFAAPSSLGLLTATFSEGKQRLRALALFTTVSAAGGAVGLVSGGLIVQWLSWRWVMFVNVPIGLAVLLLGRVVLAETSRRSGHFDIGGAVTSTAGMSGLVLGLVEAGSQGWSSRLTIVPLGLGAVLLALFVRNERRAAEPILPLRLLANVTRSSANVARGLVYAGMYGVFFFMSQLLQQVDGYSPLRTGLSFLPIPVSVFLSSQAASRLLGRGVSPKVLMLSGTGTAIVSLLAAAGLSEHASAFRVLVNFVLFGVGMGISLVSLTSASLADVAPQDAGAASGLVNVVQQLGAALGLAVLVNVFSATAHTGAGLAEPGDAVLVHGIHIAFLAGTAFAVAALGLVALGVRVARPLPAPVGAGARERELDLSQAHERYQVDELTKALENAELLAAGADNEGATTCSGLAGA